jgi:hypothetical protein
VLNDPLMGGMAWTCSVGERLIRITGPEFEGKVDASLTFFAAGRMFRSDWFRFNVMVHNGHVLNVDAISVPARRARVAHAHEETEEAEGSSKLMDNAPAVKPSPAWQ